MSMRGGATARSRRLGQPVGDPAADRIVAAGEEPGVVRVQALHAPAGAADAARSVGAPGGRAGWPRRAPGRSGRAPRRCGRGRRPPRRRPPRPRSRAGRPRPARPRRPASSGWASGCRRAAAARCARRPGRPSASRTTTSNSPRGGRPRSAVDGSDVARRALRSGPWPPSVRSPACSRSRGGRGGVVAAAIALLLLVLAPAGAAGRRRRSPSRPTCAGYGRGRRRVRRPGHHDRRRPRRRSR